MTYNIHHCRGTDNRVDVDRIAQLISRSDSDIVGLNEVDKQFSRRSAYKDQIEWLAKQLNMEQAFSPSLSIKSSRTTSLRQFGNAILSRYPIVTRTSQPFDFLSGFMEGRSLLNTAIQINKKLVQFSVTHFSLNPFLHRLQTNFVLNELNRSPYPTILMGDFNMTPRSKGWRKITSQFQDVWQMAGNGKGYTYPAFRPSLRLDYIFASPSLGITNAKVVTHTPKASDHLPLQATLFFNKKGS